MEALPNVNALANVEEDKLLKLWEGLGYYNRVRNMQKSSQTDHGRLQWDISKTYEEIQSLTGIGNYTAGAISSFSFGLPYPAVDGNVLRVITRITADDSDIMKQSTRKQIEEKNLKNYSKRLRRRFLTRDSLNSAQLCAFKWRTQMRRMSGSTILPGKNTRKNPGTSSKRKSKSKTNRKKDSTHLAR